MHLVEGKSGLRKLLQYSRLIMCLAQLHKMEKTNGNTLLYVTLSEKYDQSVQFFLDLNLNRSNFLDHPNCRKKGTNTLSTFEWYYHNYQYFVF